MTGDDSRNPEPPTVAYGIDIGVYRHRMDGQIRAETTFGWARAESDVELKPTRTNGSWEFSFIGEYDAGRDVRELASEIRRDLSEGLRIAIGIEAPMWQPAPTEIPEGAFDLFPIRFDQERGFAWYLQSGASALARALSTGRLLLSLLGLPSSQVRCSTVPSTDANVELFEGFVAGHWKLDALVDLEQGPHAWDALTTAVAFHYARRRPVEEELSLIHASGTHESQVISHWQTIMESSGHDGTSCGSDCLVVGFDSSSDHVAPLADNA